MQVFKDTYPDFIEVFQKSIKNWNQIRSCQLVPKNNRKLVDGEC